MDTSKEDKNVPRFVLEIVPHAANGTFITTAIISFLVTLRRLPDLTNKPCIVSWNASQHCMFENLPVLFHKAETGFKKLESQPVFTKSINPPQNKKESVQITNASCYSHHFVEVPPNGCLAALVTLSPNYQQQLIPGQRYRLQWPTSEIVYWNWGSLADNMGSHIEYHGPGGASSPPIVLPPPGEVNFATAEASDPWPHRDKVESGFGYFRANLEETVWRREKEQQQSWSARAEKSHQERHRQLVSSPGAPVFKATLECPPIVHLDETLNVTAHIELTNAGPDARPVTFHTVNIDSRCFWLFRKRRTQSLQTRNFDNEVHQDELRWEYCNTEGDCVGHVTVDDPAVSVKVGGHDNFVSLQPGQTWKCSYSVEIDNWTYPTGDTGAGDVFRVWYAGGELDWWDWGGAAEHANTELVLPCFLYGAVVKPLDNDGRPVARVIASESVDFVVHNSRG